MENTGVRMLASLENETIFKKAFISFDEISRLTGLAAKVIEAISKEND